MGKKKTKNKRKTELKSIFFVILIAAALFIVSTYAWFTTQRNISITNLEGVVEVAEGLEVSLNAKNWSSQIVLGTSEGNYNITNSSTDYGPYQGHTNILPSEMIPVSTLGLVENSTMSDLLMYRGKASDSNSLQNIVQTRATVTDATSLEYPGYIVFDIFLKNTSRRDVVETLQLNYDSSLSIPDDGNDEVGLQNTARVAFARFGSVLAEGGTTWTGVADSSTTDQATILKETGAVTTAGDTPVYITDVAIWEPNSNDHVQHIVDNNNNIIWSSEDAAKYETESLSGGKMGFGTGTQMPTYALTSSANGSSIANLYDWSGTNSATLQRQVTLQTTKRSETDYTINEGVQNLVSTSGSGNLTIAPNSIIRLRVYVWLEGQDVDCINYASHGGKISVNIGLVKGSTVGSRY